VGTKQLDEGLPCRTGHGSEERAATTEYESDEVYYDCVSVLDDNDSQIVKDHGRPPVKEVVGDLTKEQK